MPTNLNIEYILLYFDRMTTDLLIDQELVKNSTKLLSILSNKDNFTIFLFASGDGLKADSSILGKLGLTRIRHYTRLRQLMEAGLINKSVGSYSHTDTWKYHLSEISEWINARNSRYKAGEDDRYVNMYKTVF